MELRSYHLQRDDPRAYFRMWFGDSFGINDESYPVRQTVVNADYFDKSIHPNLCACSFISFMVWFWDKFQSGHGHDYDFFSSHLCFF